MFHVRMGIESTSFLDIKKTSDNVFFYLKMFDIYINRETRNVIERTDIISELTPLARKQISLPPSYSLGFT